jgi:hypothetical protein
MMSLQIMHDVPVVACGSYDVPVMPVVVPVGFMD